jgi:hypothetical protein
MSVLEVFVFIASQLCHQKMLEYINDYKSDPEFFGDMTIIDIFDMANDHAKHEVHKIFFEGAENFSAQLEKLISFVGEFKDGGTNGSLDAGGLRNSSIQDEADDNG